MKPILSVAELGCPEDAVADLQGWHSTDPFFRKIIAELDPETIVEVGTWKGASAIHMASLTEGIEEYADDVDPYGESEEAGYDLKNVQPAKIYCCDTFLGGIDHLEHEDTPPNGLNRRHGFPQIYFTFLKNVTDSGYAQRIYPIPQSSINGARFLHAHSISADLIYIDASHQINDVYADLQAYWPLLRQGGVMFGDDMAFPGVTLDTNRFAIERGLQLKVENNNFWVLRKS